MPGMKQIPALFFKAHVNTYTRKDGSVVEAHDDKRPSAAPTGFKAGDRVRIKPEHQDDGDDEFEWHAVDNEEKGRVTISPKNGMKIPPQYVVHSHMIEHHKD